MTEKEKDELKEVVTSIVSYANKLQDSFNKDSEIDILILANINNQILKLLPKVTK